MTVEVRIPSPARATAERYAKLPLVYSCSGCSSAAQLANALAVRLDREERAEMSCIVGVGGNVKPLVRTATSGRPILVLDGCPLRCSLHSLALHGVTPTAHLDLSEEGVKKRFHEDATHDELERIWHDVVLPGLERVEEAAAPDAAP
jgi:uncharacterized metal-binding protein